MEEIWKDIPGYEGKYQVSDLGNIKSLPFQQRNYEKVLKTIPSNSGYERVRLSKNNVKDQRYVHRLVMLVFVGESGLEINHKNGNKLDNRFENLEYCTRGENLSHAYKNGLKKPNVSSQKTSKKVNQYSLEGNFIKTRSSIRSASIGTGANQICISRCCNINEGSNTAGGYKREYL